MILGVLIWVGDVFGEQLKTPECGDISAAVAVAQSGSRGRSAIDLHRRDAAWIKQWK